MHARLPQACGPRWRHPAIQIDRRARLVQIRAPALRWKMKPAASTPAYTLNHPRWYRKRVSTYWWLQRWEYLRFVLREDAADFAQYESQILPALEPPVGGNAFAIPARVVESISGCGGSGFHFPPQGRSTDLNQSSAAVNLYCWMAPAGSTCLGQTRVHSPTNVQPQMASCWERTGKRSFAPSSRESRLYRWARAIAAGPANKGSRP